MHKLVGSVSLCLGLLLWAQTAAAATIIGNIRYEEDLLTGSTAVAVENFAATGDPFTEVIVTLQTLNASANGQYGYGIVTGQPLPAFIFDFGSLGTDFSFVPLAAFDFANLPLDPADGLLAATIWLRFQANAISSTPAVDLINRSENITVAPARTSRSAA